jgi:hypothetical protein
VKLRVVLGCALAVVGLVASLGVASASAGSERAAGNGTVAATGSSRALGVTPAMYVDWNCPVGYLCTGRVANGKVVFNRFYYCERIWLSNWTGTGSVFNNQTPGTVATFYDQNGRVLFRSTAKQLIQTVDWNPIWSFQVC